MTMISAYHAEGAGELDPRVHDLIVRRERLLGPAYRLFYRHPLHIVRGCGVYLYDASGREYLDAYNNVACVGHCHPEVVEAIAIQAATLNTHTRYLHADILDYSERLLGTLPATLGHIMFTCSGSEANDLALRIARRFTGGNGFIVTSLAYHGGTAALAELSPSLGPGVPLGPHVRTVAPPNPYHSNGDAGAAFTGAVIAAMRDLEASGIRFAGLILDTLLSSDGVIADPRGHIRGAVDAVHAAGGLFIADEVQPGFGRIGEEFWGFRRHGVEPDLVSMGKPMGAGHPIAALAMRPDVVARFGAEARYFNTFGGNPVSIAAAQAVLRIIHRERLAEHAASVGEYLRGQIAALEKRHVLIGDVRGAGLFLGVELVRDRSTKVPATDATSHVVNSLREHGVLISACGPGANVLKIRPPLIFQRTHADLLVERLDQVLWELQDAGRS